jgi:Tol biopolymer transport system component
MATMTGCALRAFLGGALLFLLVIATGMMLGRASGEQVILFMHQERGLYVYSLDRAALLPVITGLPSPPINFNWSPDGSRISFTLLDANQYAVYTYDPYSRRRSLIADGLPLQDSVSWSPDGHQLALISPAQDICIYTRDGTPLRCLGVGPVRNLRWSPNAAAPAIVYSPPGNRLQNSGTFLVDLSTGQVRTLADITPSHTPRWSPDGRSIALYQQIRGSRDDLYITAVDTGRTERYPLRGRLQASTWSPDGREIVYVTLGAAPNTYVLDLKSGTQTSVLHAYAIGEAVAWSPNAALLAFTAGNFDRAALFVTKDGQLYDQVSAEFIIHSQSFQFAWRP